MLPDDLDDPCPPDIGITGDERQVQVDGRRTNQRIEWVTIDAGFVGDEDLRRAQVVRLIGRVAEQVVEKASNGAAQVDPRGARQQASLPDDCRRHVEDRLTALTSLEMRRCAATESIAPARVKQQGVRIAHGRRQFSHVVFVPLDIVTTALSPESAVGQTFRTAHE